MDPTSKLEKLARDIQIGADPTSKLEKLARDILFGALTVARLHGETGYGLYARPLRDAVSPGSPELKTPDGIRTYITNAVGQALGL